MKIWKTFVEEKHFFEWNHHTWFLLKFQLKAAVKAIDGSNYLGALIQIQMQLQIQMLWQPFCSQ